MRPPTEAATRFQTVDDATFGPRYTTATERVRLRTRRALSPRRWLRRLKALCILALRRLRTDDAGDFGI